MGKDTRDKWFCAIFTGIMLTSVIVFFWVPLFFVLAPGEPYRMMGGALCTLIVVVLSLIYAFVLLFFGTRRMLLKMLAIAAVLMPIALLVFIMLLLGAMGHAPAP